MPTHAINEGNTYMLNLDHLLTEKPKFHQERSGKNVSWAANPNVLRYIEERLEPSMSTIETGSGYSTVVFALSGTNHTCVTPSHHEGKNILAYCKAHGIDPNITFDHRSSDLALADKNTLGCPLHFAFIDGAHRFPFPCIDFHFIEKWVAIDGILGIDDFRMPSVRIVHDFLCKESSWKLVQVVDNTSFFQRIAETEIMRDWQGQGINKGYLDKLYKRRKRSVYVSRARWLLHKLQKRLG